MYRPSCCRMTERSVLIVSVVFVAILNAVRGLNDKITIDETSVKPTSSEDSLTNISEARSGDVEKRDAAENFEDQKIEGDWMKRATMGFRGMREKKDDEAIFHFNPSPVYGVNETPQWTKRASMGFHGMRGKKFDYYEPFDSLNSYDNWEKKAALGFNGMRGKKSPWHNAAEKKAAMGFNGMRGKKSYVEDDFLNEVEPEEYAKRATMGFHGMRGKKADEGWEWDKRASMGFHGMRGKKDDAELKRAMGFLGMRGKKDNWDLMSSEAVKRAPQAGFFGVRGKKFEDNEDDLNTLLTFLREAGPQLNHESNVPLERARRATYWARNSKKAKAAAFFGMRGKKSWIIANDSPASP